MRAYQIREDDAWDDTHPADIIEPPAESPHQKTADALMVLVAWLSKSGPPAHMGARVLVMAVALSIENLSWAEIARRSGVTREAVRLMASELEDLFNLRTANSRKDSTRAACRRSRIRVVERQKRQRELFDD